MITVCFYNDIQIFCEIFKQKVSRSLRIFTFLRIWKKCAREGKNSLNNITINLYIIFLRSLPLQVVTLSRFFFWDLFSLICLFNHFRPPLFTQGNVFSHFSLFTLIWMHMQKCKNKNKQTKENSAKNSNVTNTPLPSSKNPHLKMRPSAQPFLWKWILFAWEWTFISISKAEHLTSFWYRGPEELRDGLFYMASVDNQTS